MVEAGLITLVLFISPFAIERDSARQALSDGQFIEVFVKTSLAEVEKRDVKGLYTKARSGLLKNFTGIDSPYEEPKNPDIVVETENFTAEECAEKIISFLSDKGHILGIFLKKKAFDIFKLLLYVYRRASGFDIKAHKRLIV